MAFISARNMANVYNRKKDEKKIKLVVPVYYKYIFF